MPGSSGQHIAQDAIALRWANPEWPALQVLDVAMDPHVGSHPGFECRGKEFDHWIDPPSEFAELLRAAFDPEIEQADLQLMVTHTDDESLFPRLRAIEERWQGVIDRFGERYKLWSI